MLNKSDEPKLEDSEVKSEQKRPVDEVLETVSPPDSVGDLSSDTFTVDPMSPVYDTGAFSPGVVTICGSPPIWDEMLGPLRQHGLDVALVFDSTGSMDGEVREVKRLISSIGNSLMTLVPRARISVCTYRDEGDEYVVQGLPLTNDLQEVHDFLRPIQASGGGDRPESVQMGLRWAVTKSQFRPRARKVILLFGDAPPHPQDHRECLDIASDFDSQHQGVVSTVTCRNRVKLAEFVAIAEVGGGESFLTTDLACTQRPIGHTFVVCSSLIPRPQCGSSFQPSCLRYSTFPCRHGQYASSCHPSSGGSLEIVAARDTIGVAPFRWTASPWRKMMTKLNLVRVARTYGVRDTANHESKRRNGRYAFVRCARETTARLAMLAVVSGFTVGSGSLALSADDAPRPEAMVYKTTPEGIEISADVYRADATDGPRPVIVWYHGGALMFGSRTGVPPQLVDLGRKDNLVLVSMDYRLAPGAQIDQIVADVKDGLEWVRKTGSERFGVDPDRLLVAGASAGGYLAMMSGIALDPPPKALVSYWGFGDIDGAWCNTPNENYGRHLASASEEELWQAVGDKVLTSTTKKTGAAQANLFLFLKRNGGWGKMVSGFDPDSERDKMAPYCPLRSLTPDYPPILLLHGTRDNDVPYACATDMVEALKKVGIPHELITVEGGGHGLWGGDRKEIEAAFERSLDFIREQLSSSESRGAGVPGERQTTTCHPSLGPLPRDSDAPTGAKARLDLPLAQAGPPDNLEEFVASVAEAVIESGESVGLSVAIANGDESWLAKGYGFANLELKVPATARSVYRIGSITKQFTAAGVLLLAEDGKLSLDDPLTRFLPDYPTGEHQVTIRHLLQHTSGIKSFTSLPASRREMHRPMTHKDIIGRFQDEPFMFAPGEKFSYCNSGYYLLGVIIEKASGQTYEEFLTERVFQVLSLKATAYDRHGRIIPDRAAGYGPARGGGVRNADYLNMGQPFAAGALVSTVEDLIRWQRSLVHHELLEPASWKAMTTCGKLKDGSASVYGLGVFLRKLDDHPTIRHGGGINGFRSDLAYFPDQDITIAVLANTEGARPAKITDQIAGHLFQSGE